MKKAFRNDKTPPTATISEMHTMSIKGQYSMQLRRELKRQRMSKSTLARSMHTSRAIIDKLVDPFSMQLQLRTMQRAAHVLGKKLRVMMVRQ